MAERDGAPYPSIGRGNEPSETMFCLPVLDRPRN
jgi:hypothetical protein